MTAALANGRIRTAGAGGLAALVVVGIVAAAWLIGDAGMRADFSARLLPPQAAHPFGTDHMGRDNLARTLHGLTLSLQIGFLAATISTLIALMAAVIAGWGRWCDALIGGLTDVMLAMPHLLLLLMICFALGGGTQAVIIAVALSHWPRLARILRAELIQIMAAPWIEVSAGLGRSRLFILRHHVLPHLMPQVMVGFLLMFPHAILHEAGLTFLGFGLEPSRPAIGVMLSDSMRHLVAGRWWLALFPGAALLALVLCFEMLGGGLRRLTDPREARL